MAFHKVRDPQRQRYRVSSTQKASQMIAKKCPCRREMAACLAQPLLGTEQTEHQTSKRLPNRNFPKEENAAQINDAASRFFDNRSRRDQAAASDSFSG